MSKSVILTPLFIGISTYLNTLPFTLRTLVVSELTNVTSYPFSTN